MWTIILVIVALALAIYTYGAGGASEAYGAKHQNYGLNHLDALGLGAAILTVVAAFFAGRLA